MRRWIKVGLQTIDNKRPMLVLGTDLIVFLRTRQGLHKHRCLPGQLYCVRCRAPKFPAAGMVDYRQLNVRIGNLTAICQDCNSIMHRCVSLAKLGEVRGEMDISFTQALPRLRESSQPTVNSDLR